MPWLFPKGYLAVDFFFMLSGYVLSRTYDTRLGSGELTMATFMKRRFRLLWPTMALATIIGLPVLIWFPAEARWIVFLLNLFFIPLIVGINCYPMNGPTWSIFFELWANAVHAAFLHSLSVRRLAIVAVASGGLTLGFAAAWGSLDIGGEASSFYTGLPRSLMSYTIGMIMWRALRDRPPLAIPMPLTVAMLPVAAFLPVHNGMADVLIVLTLAPTLIIGGLNFSAGRIGLALGALSFPIYAFHGPAMGLVINAAPGVLYSVALGTAGALAIHAAFKARAFIVSHRSPRPDSSSPSRWS